MIFQSDNNVRRHVHSKFHALASILLLSIPAVTFAKEMPNPNYVYFSAGDTPDNWTWVLSDPDNWWMPLDGNEGKSAQEKVRITPASFQSEKDAVNIQWSKSSTWGSATISGREVDLSGYENAAELSVALKVKKRSKSEVKLTMNCGENCSGEVQIGHILNKAPLDQWFLLPVPLNCLRQSGADLSKVIAPFSIGTTGSLELEIAEIQIMPLADGDKGCAAEDS